MRPITVGWLLILGLLLSSCPLPAQTPPAARARARAAVGAAPEQDPGRILQKVCRFPEVPAQFTYKAEVTDDQVYYGGKKLQYGLDMETSVRRPDRLPGERPGRPGQQAALLR